MQANERFAMASGQAEMFPREINALLPFQPQGQHIEFAADVGGYTYYCKGDKNGCPLRATEWLASSLAMHLKIPVPDFAPIRNPMNGDVLFGSKGVWGTASPFEAATFLTTPPNQDKAMGDAYPWLSPYLSRLYVYDLFMGNPDRQLCNFLLVQDSGVKQLLAYDFASAKLDSLGITNFSIAETQTLQVGRSLRKLRAFNHASAIEMIDLIEAVPASMVHSFFATMPSDWLTDDDRGEICGFWSNGRVGERLAALRNGISDESLL